MTLTSQAAGRSMRSSMSPKNSCVGMVTDWGFVLESGHGSRQETTRGQSGADEAGGCHARRTDAQKFPSIPLQH